MVKILSESYCTKLHAVNFNVWSKCLSLICLFTRVSRQLVGHSVYP